MVVQVLHAQQKEWGEGRSGTDATNPSSSQMFLKTRSPEGFYKSQPESGKARSSGLTLPSPICHCLIPASFQCVGWMQSFPRDPPVPPHSPSAHLLVAQWVGLISQPPHVAEGWVPVAFR